MCDCNSNSCGCGNIQIPQGPAGTSITNTEIQNGDLIIYYSDGTSTNVGNVIGADGADGEDGNMWFTGQGTPSGATGNDDDFFLDSSTGDYYKKIGGVWILQGNLQGPPGPQGEQGPAGSGGVATSFDFSAGDSYQEASPAVIHDVGWSSVTVNSATDSNRYSFGDLHVVRGTLSFTGTYDGSLAEGIYVPLGGPALASGVNYPVMQTITVSGVGELNVRSYLDSIGSTAYVRFFIDQDNLPTTSATYLMTYHLLVLYPS